jgi:uncharacterized protein (DUF1697 family)
MPTYIALLRGINVGGKNKVPMPELRTMLEEVGFSHVETLIQSGNCIFDGKKATLSNMETKLEKAFSSKFGFAAEFVTRSGDEWNSLLSQCAFPEFFEQRPNQGVVYFFKQPLDSEKVKKLKAAVVGSEQLKASRRELFATYPDGIGDSKLTIAVIDKQLGRRGTARNWNTIQKIGLALSARS